MPVLFSRVESGWPEQPIIASAATTANPYTIVFVVDVLTLDFSLVHTSLEARRRLTL